MAVDPICGMKVDEKSALKLVRDGQEHFFCSEHCRGKYAQDHRLPLARDESHCCSPPAVNWYRNKTLVVIAALAAIIGLSYALPFLIPFRETLFFYVRAIWWA